MILKQLNPSPSSATENIAYSASPRGLLTLARRATGPIVNDQKQLFTAEESKLNQINIPFDRQVLNQKL